MKNTIIRHKIVPLGALVLSATLFAGLGLAQTTEAAATSPVALAATPSNWSSLVDVAFARAAAGADTDADVIAAQAGNSLLARRYPGTLEVDGGLRQDIIGSGKGYREASAGVTASLWRRGEREGLRSQSAGETALANRQKEAAKLEIAGQVRAAWWALEAARAEVGVLEDQTRFAGDVVTTTSRLVEAGEMARLDLLQAQTAQAALKARLATAQGAQAQARAAFVGLVGEISGSLPMETIGALNADNHPDVLALQAQAQTLEAQSRLVRLQAGPAWRVGLDVRAERGLSGDSTVTSTGVRAVRPFGAAPSGAVEATGFQARATAVLTRATARKLAIEAARQEAVARLSGARAAQIATTTQRDAAAEALALTLRGRAEGELSFFEELRARALLADGERANALARVEIGAAISAFNQAQGLLP